MLLLIGVLFDVGNIKKREWLVFKTTHIEGIGFVYNMNLRTSPLPDLSFEGTVN